MTEPQRWEYWWKTFTSDEKPKGFSVPHVDR